MTEDNKCTLVGQLKMEKVQQTLNEVLLKLEKMNSIETKLTGISTQITGIDGRLSTLEGRTTSLEGQYAQLAPNTEKVNELEQSVTFLSEKYEEMKKASEAQKTWFEEASRNIGLATAETIMLKARIEDLQNSLEQEKIARNTESQYWKTCLNLKLCGIPIQPGEEIRTSSPTNPVTRSVVERICQAAQINLPPGALDVCHRLGNDTTSPIILRFSGKGARYSFFNQRHKLKAITSNDVDFNGLPQIQPPNGERGGPGGRRGGRRGGRHGDRHGGQQRQQTTIPTTGSKIYIQEHLTNFNRSLLKATKTMLDGKFQFPGYIMHGEVRCKIAENADYDVIRCASDIQNMMEKHGIEKDSTILAEI